MNAPGKRVEPGDLAHPEVLRAAGRRASARAIQRALEAFASVFGSAYRGAPVGSVEPRHDEEEIAVVPVGGTQGRSVGVFVSPALEGDGSLVAVLVVDDAGAGQASRIRLGRGALARVLDAMHAAQDRVAGARAATPPLRPRVPDLFDEAPADVVASPRLAPAAPPSRPARLPTSHAPAVVRRPGEAPASFVAATRGSR